MNLKNKTLLLISLLALLIGNASFISLNSKASGDTYILVGIAYKHTKCSDGYSNYMKPVGYAYKISYDGGLTSQDLEKDILSKLKYEYALDLESGEDQIHFDWHNKAESLVVISYNLGDKGCNRLKYRLGFGASKWEAENDAIKKMKQEDGIEHHNLIGAHGKVY